MNNDFWFDELKNIYSQIEKTSINGTSTVIGAFDNVMALLDSTGKKGSERAGAEGICLDGSKASGYFTYLLDLFNENLYPEIIEEFGTYRYIADNVTEYDALAYFVYLAGIVGIAEKTDADIVSGRLMAALPPYIRKEIMK